MSSSDVVYNAAGIVGSLITAMAILPQILRVVQRRSSADISYTYQAVFITGISMFLLYYGYYELWEVFVPTTLSVGMMLTLVLLKVYYEELSPPPAVADAGEDAGTLEVTPSHGAKENEALESRTPTEQAKCNRS